MCDAARVAQGNERGRMLFTEIVLHVYINTHNI